MAGDQFQVNADRIDRLVYAAEDEGMQVLEATSLTGDGYTFEPVFIDSPSELNAEILREVPDLPILPSYSLDEYIASPFLPVVAKDEASQRGDNKFLLETPEQWQKMHAFLMKTVPIRNPPQNVIDGLAAAEIAIASEEVQSDPEWLEEWVQFKRKAQRITDGFAMLNTYGDPSDAFTYQPLIETPGDRFTSYRTVVSSAGQILASSLYYSGFTKSDAPIMSKEYSPNNEFAYRNSLTALRDPHSNVFLGSRQFMSNRSTGGRGIVLDPTADSLPRTATDREVLTAHGIDPIAARLPERLRTLSSEIGQKVGPKLGIVLGIDWIQDKDGNFHFLEANVMPQDGAFCDRHGLKPSDDTYLKMFRVAYRSIVEQHGV